MDILGTMYWRIRTKSFINKKNSSPSSLKLYCIKLKSTCINITFGSHVGRCI